MKELLNNAWIGWQAYISAGKLAALLGASLLFLWMVYRKNSRKSLLIYGTVLAVGCVIPVTAAGLMLYQTKFYDYQWIWSLVPVTTLIAYGAVCFLGEHKGDWRLVGLLLVALTLCGGMGKTPVQGDTSATERVKAEAVLQQLREKNPEGGICLWAPREIMEYAREADASVRLLYGRNMWDEWLNAYSYDTYSDELVALYEWMEAPAGVSGEQGKGELPAESGQAGVLSGENRRPAVAKQAKAAVESGVNCIVLPGEKSAAEVKALEELLGSSAQEYNGYYLLVR